MQFWRRWTEREASLLVLPDGSVEILSQPNLRDGVSALTGSGKTGGSRRSGSGRRSGGLLVADVLRQYPGHALAQVPSTEPLPGHAAVEPGQTYCLLKLKLETAFWSHGNCFSDDPSSGTHADADLPSCYATWHLPCNGGKDPCKAEGLRGKVEEDPPPQALLRRHRRHSLSTTGMARRPLATRKLCPEASMLNLTLPFAAPPRPQTGRRDSPYAAAAPPAPPALESASSLRRALSSASGSSGSSGGLTGGGDSGLFPLGSGGSSEESCGGGSHWQADTPLACAAAAVARMVEQQQQQQQQQQQRQWQQWQQEQHHHHHQQQQKAMPPGRMSGSSPHWRRGGTIPGGMRGGQVPGPVGGGEGEDWGNRESLPHLRSVCDVDGPEGKEAEVLVSNAAGSQLPAVRGESGTWIPDRAGRTWGWRSEWGDAALRSLTFNQEVHRSRQQRGRGASLETTVEV